MSHPRPRLRHGALRSLQPALAGACAASIAAPALALDDLEPESRWFFRLGGMVRSGIQVSVRDNLPPAPTGAGEYQNGFVLPSVSGPGAGLTWNWGYEDASQVDTAADTLNYSRFNDAPRVGTLSRDESVFGGEAVVGFELTRVEWKRRELRIGLEAGYSLATMATSLAGTASATATRTTAAYALNGILPPLAPYAGSFNGPGPLINLQPTTLGTQSAPGTQSLAATVDAAFHALRLGPYVEMPIGNRLLVGVGLGYATMYTDAELSFTETTTYQPDPANPGTPPLPGAALNVQTRRGAWQPGAYFQLRARYHFTTRLSAFLSGDYLYHSDLHIRGGGREARIGLGGLLGGSLGLQFEF